MANEVAVRPGGRKLATDRALAFLSQARTALTKASAVPEVVDVHNKVETLTGYIRRAGGSLDLQNDAGRLAIDCARKAGPMIPELFPAVRPKKALHHVRLKDIGLSHVESHRWQRLGAIPGKIVDAYDAETRAMTHHPEAPREKVITKAGLLRFWKELQREKRREEVGGVSPEGIYRAMVIDPPWPVEKIERDVRPKQAEFDYPVMTLDEIQQLPVADHADEGCHLYLWTTHKHLPAAVCFPAVWGFKYQCLMTWVKNVGFTPFSWMYSTEHVIFATRGGLRLLEKGIRLDFSAKVREHSRKPDEFYDIVRRASPERRLDWFSREVRDGFEQCGNEPERFKAEA